MYIVVELTMAVRSGGTNSRRTSRGGFKILRRIGLDLQNKCIMA
jgi:hypothetical protein